MRRLSGWTPTTYTRVERDGRGRVVGEVTFTESEWTPDEVALLLAAREVEQDRGSHGFPMSEATDPANQFAYVGDTAPLVDFIEKARLDAQDAYFKAHDTRNNPVNRNGLIFRVRKRNAG